MLTEVEDLEALLKQVEGRTTAFRTQNRMYRELQLHGDLLLQQHVEAVCMRDHYRQQPDRLNDLLTLCDKLGMPLICETVLVAAIAFRLKPADVLARRGSQLETQLPVKELERLRSTFQLDTPFHSLCGPQNQDSRRLFDKMCHLMVALDMLYHSSPPTGRDRR